MKNVDRVKLLVYKIESRSDFLKMPESDMDKRARLNFLLYGDLYLDDRETQVTKYKISQKLRKAHIDKFNKIREDKRLKIKEDKLTFRAEKHNEQSLKSDKPVLWSAQFITYDVKRTNITRRINESLAEGKVTGKELVRLYKVVGLGLDDRRQLSKRLVECGLIARSVSTRRLETLVKTEILKLNSRIAGTKLPQLTLVAETLGINLDDLYIIYKKLSTQESIDRRNLRAQTIID